MGEFGHHIKHLVDHLRVERRCRLIEEHDFRFHRESAGDGHTLLLAAGQLCRHLLGLGIHADTREQIHGQILCLVLGHMAHFDWRERHILENRFIGEQVEGLEHHADFGAESRELLALLRQRLAVDADIARIDGLETVDGAAHRGFARA